MRAKQLKWIGLASFLMIVVVSSVSAKIYPFVGTWGDAFTNAPEGCNDPKNLSKITTTDHNGCKITAITYDGYWYHLTVKCKGQKKVTYSLNVENDTLSERAEAENDDYRTTLFTYPRCN